MDGQYCLLQRCINLSINVAFLKFLILDLFKIFVYKLFFIFVNVSSDHYPTFSVVYFLVTAENISERQRRTKRFISYAFLSFFNPGL